MNDTAINDAAAHLPTVPLLNSRLPGNDVPSLPRRRLDEKRCALCNNRRRSSFRRSTRLHCAGA
jgi:exoribonuclease II